MKWPNWRFEAGIERYIKEAGLEGEEADRFFRQVLDQTEDTVRQVKAALDMGAVKEASADFTALDNVLLKIARDEGNFEKVAVIRQESCTDSDGNEGSWVLYDSEGNKQLGCHKSEASAKEQERAIQASKHAGYPGEEQGREGRRALAEKYTSGGDFDHSQCVSEQSDNVDDPHGFCRYLEQYVHGEGNFEATTGENEGEVAD